MKTAIPTTRDEQIASKCLHIFICRNAPCCDQFTVLKETAKAIQVECDDVDKKHRFPVWVPKSAIKEDWSDLPGIGRSCTLFWAGWFRQKMEAEKAWKRVALALSVW